MLIRDLLHTREHVVLRNEHIAKQNEERFAFDLISSTMNGMTKAKRFILVNVGNIQTSCVSYLVGIAILTAATQFCFQIGIGSKVRFDRLLVATVDDDHFIGTRSEPLLNNILNSWLVNNEQHFFRLCFSGREESTSETCGRNERFHVYLVFVLVRCGTILSNLIEPGVLHISRGS